jgi:hypothetical protein
MPPRELAELDEWIGKQNEALTRPEAIRRIVGKSLGRRRQI